MTDNGVVVVQVFGEPLLGYRLLRSSRWAHNLWRRSCSPWDPTHQRQCAWLLSTYLEEGEEQKEMLEAKDDEEKESEVDGEVEERERERVNQRVHET